MNWLIARVKDILLQLWLQSFHKTNRMDLFNILNRGAPAPAHKFSWAELLSWSNVLSTWADRFEQLLSKELNWSNSSRSWTDRTALVRELNFLYSSVQKELNSSRSRTELLNSSVQKELNWSKQLPFMNWTFLNSSFQKSCSIKLAVFYRSV